MGFRDLLAAADHLVRKHTGEAITYAPAVGPPVTVQGIFDALFRREDLGHAGVSTSGPAVFLTLADLPSDPEADTAAVYTIRGVAYRAVDDQVDKDGQGGVAVHLHTVA